MKMKTKVKMSEKLWWNDTDMGKLYHSVWRLGENTNFFFYLKPSVFWNFTLRILVVNVRRFGSSSPRECREKEDALL